jgi:hypothetical protein
VAARNTIANLFTLIAASWGVSLERCWQPSKSGWLKFVRQFVKPEIVAGEGQSHLEAM